MDTSKKLAVIRQIRGSKKLAVIRQIRGRTWLAVRALHLPTVKFPVLTKPPESMRDVTSQAAIRCAYLMIFMLLLGGLLAVLPLDNPVSIAILAFAVWWMRLFMRQLFPPKNYSS